MAKAKKTKKIYLANNALPINFAALATLKPFALHDKPKRCPFHASWTRTTELIDEQNQRVHGFPAGYEPVPEDWITRGACFIEWNAYWGLEKKLFSTQKAWSDAPVDKLHQAMIDELCKQINRNGSGFNPAKPITPPLRLQGLGRKIDFWHFHVPLILELPVSGEDLVHSDTPYALFKLEGIEWLYVKPTIVK